MNKYQIGISTIEYNEDGSVKSAIFVPTLSIKPDTKLLKALEEVQNSKDITVLKNNAELVFSSWFRGIDKVITEVELGDREKFEVASSIVECLKWPNGNIKLCSMKFNYQEIPHTLN